MGRKKRPFIDRSKAKTYEVVYRPRKDTREGPERVLRLVESSSARRRRERTGEAGPDIEADPLAYKPEKKGIQDDEQALINQLDGTYHTKDYEFGEYGFNSGGYDYTKHFKQIGGDGGVFVPAKGTDVSKEEGNAELEVNRLRDEQARLKALEEIGRERKRNKDLDLVMNALGSDNESDAQHEDDSEESEEAADLLDDISLVNPDDSGLEDNFVEVADDNLKSDTQDAFEAGRRERLLDEQFDKLLAEDYGADADYLSEDVDDEDNNDLTRGAFLVDGIHARASSSTKVMQGDTGEGDEAINDGNALDKEIDGIVDKFLKGTQFLEVSEVYDNPENVAGARAAINRERDTDSTISDGSLFDSEGEDEREKWDCETILSTYSNLANRPSVIDDRGWRRRRKKRNAKSENSPSAEELLLEPEEAESLPERKASMHVVGARRRGERKEDRKLRKQEAKAKARLARQRKSELKKAFRKELTKQERHAAGMGQAKVAVRL